MASSMHAALHMDRNTKRIWNYSWILNLRTSKVCSEYEWWLKEIQKLRMYFPQTSRVHSGKTCIAQRTSNKLDKITSVRLLGFCIMLGKTARSRRCNKKVEWSSVNFEDVSYQARSFPEIFSTFQIAFLRKEKDGCWKSGCRKLWCRSWCERDATNCATHHAWKLPFVKMSASWFLNWTYFIWICAFKFILSNNQPIATLWVRDTCLIVGLLIFITASLSSKNVQLWFLLREMCFRRN